MRGMAFGARERAWKYISSARGALERLRGLKELGEGLEGRGISVESLVKAAETYVKDAEHYYSRGDYLTALAAASYAEGLIDALKYLGLAEPEWPDPSRLSKKVLVGGTFDILHPGHLDLLERASSYGRLYVVVARDSTVQQIKGRRPLLDEESRLRIVSSIRYVYEAFLGSESDIMDSVERVRPDIIVLGPDQPFDEDWVASEAERRLGFKPRVIRLESKKRFSAGITSSSDIVARICEERCSSQGQGRVRV